MTETTSLQIDAETNERAKLLAFSEAVVLCTESEDWQLGEILAGYCKKQ